MKNTIPVNLSNSNWLVLDTKPLKTLIISKSCNSKLAPCVCWLYIHGASNYLQDALQRRKLLRHTVNEDHVRTLHLQQLKQKERLQHLQSVRRSCHNGKRMKAVQNAWSVVLLEISGKRTVLVLFGQRYI